MIEVESKFKIEWQLLVGESIISPQIFDENSFGTISQQPRQMTQFMSEARLRALREELMNRIREDIAERLEDEFIREWLAEKNPLMPLMEAQDLWMELNTNEESCDVDIMEIAKAQFYSANRYIEECDEKWKYFAHKQAKVVAIIDETLEETNRRLNACEHRTLEQFAYGHLDEKIEAMDDEKWIKRIMIFGMICTVFIAVFIGQSWYL